MSKTVSLTLKERVDAVTLLNAGKFDRSTLAFVLDDIKKIVITDEEWQAANLTKSPTDEELNALSQEDRAQARQVWKWDDTVVKDVELQKATVDVLEASIKEKSDNKELTMQDAALLTLQNKLQV